MHRQRFHWYDAGIAAGFAVAALACWRWRILEPATLLVGIPSPSANSGNGDIYTQTFPMWQRAAEWMSHGELPLWNPFQYGGHPFLATALYGVLSPIAVLARLLPTAWAIEVANLAHLFLAGLFTYIYARAIRLSRAAAAFSGMTFMFSGFVLAEACWFPPAIGSAVWLPLGLAAIEVILATRAFRGVLLLALAIAIPLLSGWIQSWVYSLYCLGAYSFARLLALQLNPTARRRSAKVAGLISIGLVLGIGLAAVQLLPTLELMRLGPRQPGALSIDHTLVVGITSPQALLREMTDSSPGYPRFAYVGMLASLLAPAALLSRRRLRPVVLCFVVLSLATLAVALTVYTPALTIYRLLPGAAWFRKPQRVLFLYALAVSVLAGIGLDRLGHRDAPKNKMRRSTVIAGAFALSVLALASVAAPAWSWGYLLAGLALLIGITRAVGRRVRSILMAMLFALALVDLMGAARNPYLHPIQNTESLDAAAKHFEFIRSRQGLHRTYFHGTTWWDFSLAAKQGTLRGVYSITDYEPLSLSRYQDVFDLVGTGAAEREAKHTTFTGELAVSPESPQFRWLDFFGVRFIVAPALAIPFQISLMRSQAGWQRAAAANDGKYVVYEKTNPFPRAYVAHGVRRVADRAQALRAISEPDFDPRATVIVERDEEAAEAIESVDGESHRAATISEYHPRRVVVQTNDPAPGYLVLTDTSYPGWKAEVDGVSAPILTANYLFRAVPVGGGAHTVTFTYAPASFALGLTITVGSLLALLAGGLRTRSRRGGHRLHLTTRNRAPSGAL